MRHVLRFIKYCCCAILLTLMLPDRTAAQCVATIVNLTTPACSSSPFLKLSATGVAPSSTYQWMMNGTVTTGATSNTFYLYHPAPGVCIRVATSCSGGATTGTSAPYCYSPAAICIDSVWPGDANYDHIADAADVLDIALAYGDTGSVRAGASTAYSPQFSYNWPDTIASHSGINAKHADCNGDGIVDATDTLAVTLNYGLTHLKEAGTPGSKVAGLPDLYFDLSGIRVTPGLLVNIPVKFGTTASPVMNIMGISATMNINGVTPDAPPELDFSGSWLGDATNTLRFAKGVTNSRTDFTWARKNHRNASGSGMLATMRFKVPTGTAGSTIRISLSRVIVIDSAGKALTAFNTIADTIVVRPTGVGTTAGTAMPIRVVPNPATDLISIQRTNAQQHFTGMAVYDVVGRLVLSANFPAGSWQTQSVSTAGLVAGSYVIRFLGDNGVIMPLIIQR